MSRWSPEERAARKEEKEAVQTAGRTESFFSRNVRLITFLVTVGLFLLACGPMFVLEARQYFGQDKDTRPDMTMNDMIRLSEQKPLYVEQLTKFSCVESDAEGQNTVVVRIEIDGGRYMAVATADAMTGVVVECLIQDMEGDSSARWNALEDDLRAIFGK
jgi:hypothetical protein